MPVSAPSSERSAAMLCLSPLPRRVALHVAIRWIQNECRGLSRPSEPRASPKARQMPSGAGACVPARAQRWSRDAGGCVHAWPPNPREMREKSAESFYEVVSTFIRYFRAIRQSSARARVSRRQVNARCLR